MSVLTRPSPVTWKGQQLAAQLSQHPFIAPLALRNGHAMTLFGFFCRRSFAFRECPDETREFVTEPGVRVLSHCHWQSAPTYHPTIILLHGLEASADARYILGTAEKAWRAGFNVVRLNMRGCGGTEQLTPALYHCGLTTDLRAIISELIERDQLPEIFVAGFSMGGNQALKLAGEYGSAAPPQLRGVCAVSPPIDLELCSQALLRPENWLYERYYLYCLRQSWVRRHEHFPDLYCLDRLDEVRRMTDFDAFALPLIGFRDINEYYAQASAAAYIADIRIPSLIIHAQDDPFIPFAPFARPQITAHPEVLMLAPECGGHTGFYGQRQADEDRFWAENRVVEFCAALSSTQ